MFAPPMINSEVQRKPIAGIGRATIAVVVTAAVVAALSLVGCAPKQNASSGSGGTNVNVMNAGESLSFANALYAQSAGYFEEEGLNVNVTPSPEDSPLTANTVAQGKVDIATIAANSAYPPIAQGRPIKLYATTMKGPTNSIALSKRAIDELAAKNITPESPLADRVSGLAGLKLAAERAGTATTAMLDKLLRSGKDPTPVNVEKLPVKVHSDGANATRAGQVDGYIAPVPDLLVGPHEGFAEVWIQFSELPEFASMPWIDVIANEQFVAENPEALDAYIRALNRAGEDFKQRPDHVEDVLKREHFADMDPELFHEAFETVRDKFTQPLAPDRDGFATQLSMYNASAEQPIELTFEDAYDTSHVNSN